MKANVIVRHGSPQESFEILEVSKPKINDHEVLIRVEAIGLNYADVMCRLGLYAYSPPLPAIVGYDVVGEVVERGNKVKNVKIGDRVMAVTPFGGYAEFAKTNGAAAIKIDQEMDSGCALALLTQYCTAYFCAEEMITLQKGDHVLIHAAAGGVGIALVQLAKIHGCVIYGTASNDEKISFLKQLGVHHPINYKLQDFEEKVISLRGNRGLDVVFDSVGGETFQKGYHLLNSGGRIVVYGSAEVTGKDKEGQIESGRAFGTYHPLQLMVASKAIIGVFMLPIFRSQPDRVRRIMKNVMTLFENGQLKPHIDRCFEFDEMDNAHAYLESRKSIGKVIVNLTSSK